MPPTIDLLAAIVRDIVSAAPDHQIIGARLGASLRSQVPDFAPTIFQSRNLRQFIRAYVPAVEERGTTGKDVIYGLTEEGRRPHPAAGAHNPQLISPPTTSFNWKAFSNPSYPFTLAANLQTGEFQVVPVEAEVSTPWIAVPKPTTEDHLEIARVFVESLHESMREPLAKILSEPRWFVHFSPAARRYGVGSSWAAFRTSRLRERFESVRRHLAIPSRAAVPSALAAEPAAKMNSVSGLMQAGKLTSQELQLRDLVSRVISQLPLSDLRELKLPVGTILDCLAELGK